MIKRTIEISSPAQLTVKHQQLIIRKEDVEHSVPFEDIGFLILNHPRILCTQAVFRTCAKHNTALIVTDDTHMPTALLLAFAPHSLQNKITKMQVEASEVVKNILWQTIIQHKITAQATALSIATGERSTRLHYLASTVKEGDYLNNEAQAAQVYFPALFGKSFRRTPRVGNTNALLNYGYSILRSACARALMGAGLNPLFGLKHDNQYNPFGLADDIMEPLRPMVDLTVYRMAESSANVPASKVPLLSLLNASVVIGKKKQPLMSALGSYCASLRSTLQTGKGTLLVPQCHE